MENSAHQNGAHMNRVQLHKFILSITTSVIFLHLAAQENAFITSDGVKLHYKVAGSGVPCLFVPGDPDFNSFSVEQTIGNILENNLQMIYVDLRGAGRSASPVDGNYSLDRMVIDFEEIRNHLGIKKWLIAGHSMSGIILMGYALRSPKSLKGMMMFNCTLDISESMQKGFIPKACELLDISGSEYFNDENVMCHSKVDSLKTILDDKDLSWQLAFSTKANAAKLKETNEFITPLNKDLSGEFFSHSEYQTNFKTYCYKVSVPVLFFYGTADWTIGADHHKGTDFPYILKWPCDTVHSPFIENKEEVEAAIVTYLKRFKL